MGIAYNPKIVTDGLVLCLDAANVKSYPGSGTSINDLSGNGNNGTLVNGPTFDSGNGGSIVFDGSNDQVDINHSTSLNITGKNISLSVWLKATALANSLHGAGIIVKGSGQNDGVYEIILTQTLSKNYTFFRMLGMANHRPALVPIELNMIYNIFCVYNNGTMFNYVNGIQEGTGSFRDVNLSTSSQLLRVGNRVVTNAAPFSGNIFNVSVYNRALSPAEIRQNFNATRGRYGI
jgi:hypothetical protein